MTTTLSPATGRDVLGAATQPARSRTEWATLTVLLSGTAALLLWHLGSVGYANTYYAGAVQAMTRSWEAFFFGSLDAGNTVTVDKPPASLWVMAASARIFGFSSWSTLVPQALMGVGTVALVYGAVRRVSGPAAGLAAGAVLALTPVAVLMFRFNNPDALLVLLMVAAAYATVRAIERAGTRWLLLAGVFIGFAFLTKMAQALVVLPALALAYLTCAPTGPWRRLQQLLAAGLAMLVSAGWWVAIAELWPADRRPYIGGSTTDSVLQLALGYNGLGRIFGQGTTGGPPGGGMGGPPGWMGGIPGFGGEPGLARMFAGTVGGQVSWLLPAGLALLVAGLWLTRRAPRTDRVRASLLLWGAWTLVTALVFSFAAGLFHDYYTVALAPGIAALVGLGGHELGQHRGSLWGRVTTAAVVAGTAAWAWVLLGRSPEFLPWLRWAVVAGAVGAVVLLVRTAGRRLLAAAAVAVTVAVTGGSAAYAAETAATPAGGSLPQAGPAVVGSGAPGGSGPGRAVPGSGPGDIDPATTEPELVALLQQAGTRWSAATVGAQSGAPLALSSGTDVMTIGGFMGADPAPTLERFRAAVAAGEVRYFVSGSGPGASVDPDRLLEQVPASVREDPRFLEFLEQMRSGGGLMRGGSGSAISTWVEGNFAATTVGGTTVYDLARPTG